MFAYSIHLHTTQIQSKHIFYIVICISVDDSIKLEVMTIELKI